MTVRGVALGDLLGVLRVPGSLSELELLLRTFLSKRRFDRSHLSNELDQYVVRLFSIT